MDKCTHFQWQKVDGRGERHATDHRYGARAVLIGHYIFLTGAGGEGAYTGDILDTRSKEWKAIPQGELELVLVMHTATLYNDLIVFLGVQQLSIDSIVPQNDAFALDVTTLETNRIPTFGAKPDCIIENTGDLYEHGKQIVLYAGMRPATGQRNDTLRILNLETMVWQIPESKGEKPPPLIRQGTCIIQHTLFLVGGDTTYGYSGAMYLLRLDQNPIYVWHRLKPIGYPGNPLVTPAVVPIGPSKILLFGGYSMGPRRELRILDNILTDRPEWHEVSNPEIPVREVASDVYFSNGYPPQRREGPCGVALCNKVIILGGSVFEGNTYFELLPAES